MKNPQQEAPSILTVAPKYDTLFLAKNNKKFSAYWHSFIFLSLYRKRLLTDEHRKTTKENANMKKRMISFLLSVVMLLTLLPQMPIEADAHKIVMTAEDFIDCLWTAYSRPNYYYNSYPYNLGYYDGSRISFDCWNLGKAIIWTKGEIVNNYTVGAYAPMDASCGLGDWDGETIIRAAPNCNGDFTELVPGEWLYMENHTGYYVGDGQVIECTAGWGVWAITVSQIDKYGNRSRNGVSGGKWNLHGMVPWLDYSGDQETWIEAACFDPMVYRDRNQDLSSSLTDAQLKEHWLNHGIKEGRASSTILDLGFYLANNPDLKAAYGTDYEKLYNHFVTSGYKEYRKSSALFDGNYYTKKYSDLASFGDEYLRHYVENGQAEGRRASLTFDPDYYWYIRPDVAVAWPNDYTMCARHYAGHGINAAVEAYDHVHPVITEATISNVSAEGYTVSCKVTDDWAISKVVFPTWTLLNDQDDLADNFMNTQKGTKNGDIYTFQVKAADHNYEGGQYVTHIYAVDKGGNTTQLALDAVEVKDTDPLTEKIILADTTSYTLEDTLLINTTAGTSVAALLTQFKNPSLTVMDKEGKPITGSATVGTGTTVNLYNGSQIVDSVTVVVLGDVDGNGHVDTTDYVRIKAAALGDFTMNKTEACAADVDKTGVVNTTDYMRIKSHFLGTFDLYAN